MHSKMLTAPQRKASSYKNNTRTAIAIAIAAALNANVVVAQTAPPATPPAASADTSSPEKIEKITVTARKVSEELQQVPLAITAFTAKALEASGVKSLQDISRLTPGMSMNDAGSEANQNPIIRGLVNISGSAIDPAVSIFLDGVFLANPSAISLGLVGIERVEVVKGPVSALYGRSAYAGAINYVSKRAPAKTGGEVAGTVGMFGQKTFTASIGGSLIPDVLRVRFGVNSDESDGSYADQKTAMRAGGYNKRNAQGSFVFTPFDRFDMSGSYYYGDDEFEQGPKTYTANNCGLRVAASSPQAGEFQRYCGRIDSHQQPVEVGVFNVNSGLASNKRLVRNSSLRAAYDFDFADLSALFGYNKVDQVRFEDFTGRRFGIPYFVGAVGTNPTGPATIVLPELFGGPLNNEDKSLEIRLASKQDQRLRWSIGNYNYKATYFQSTFVSIDGTTLPAGQTIPAGARPFVTTDGTRAFGNNNTSITTDKISSQFASIDYDVIKKLTIAGEYRTTSQKRGFDAFATATGVRQVGVPANASFDYHNYRVSAKYQFTPDAMVYVTNGDGTKAGGFNTRATIASELTFKPETSKSVEIGAKTSWLNNRLQINIAAFQIKTRDTQFSGASDDAANPGLVTKNFGGTNSNGFEAELVAVPVKGITVNLGVATADPKFIGGTYDFSNAATCAAIASCAPRVIFVPSASGPRRVVDIAGLRVPRTSKVMATAGLQVNQPIGDNMKGFGRVDFRYESSQIATDNTNLNLASYGARKVVNLRGGVEYGAYTFTAFVNNLTNDDVPAAASYNVRLNDFIGNFVNYLQPKRSFGVTVGYAF